MSGGMDEIVISDDEDCEVVDISNVDDNDVRPQSKHFTCGLCHMTYIEETGFMHHWQIDHENNNDNNNGGGESASVAQPIDLDSSDDEGDVIQEVIASDNAVSNGCSASREVPANLQPHVSLQRLTCNDASNKSSTVAEVPANVQLQVRQQRLTRNNPPSGSCRVPDDLQPHVNLGRLSDVDSRASLPATKVSGRRKKSKKIPANLQPHVCLEKVTDVDPSSSSPVTKVSGPMIKGSGRRKKTKEVPAKFQPQVCLEPLKVVGVCESVSCNEVQDSSISSTTTKGDKRQTAQSRGKKSPLSTEQQQTLKAYFNTTKHPTEKEMQQLAEAIDLTQSKVKNWFSNQRIKWKRLGQKCPKPGRGHQRTTRSPEVEIVGVECPRPSRALKEKAAIKKPGGRPAFTSAQKQHLLKAFQKTPYISDAERDNLVACTGLDAKQVKYWFVNQRIKTKTPRRTMCAYSDGQLLRLRSLFQRTQHPSLEERNELATKIGLRRRQVDFWFINQRRKPAQHSKHQGYTTGEKVEQAKAGFESQRLNHAKPAEEQNSCNRHTVQQREQLRNVFQRTKHPSVTEMAKLASAVGLTAKQVQWWFSSQRRIHKKTSGASKKAKFALTQVQLQKLEKAFQRSHYPSSDEMSALASSLGIKPLKVSVWFNNRRIKLKLEKSRDKSKSKK